MFSIQLDQSAVVGLVLFQGDITRRMAVVTGTQTLSNVFLTIKERCMLTVDSVLGGILEDWFCFAFFYSKTHEPL